MKTYIYLLLIFALVGCNNNKKYIYVEMQQEGISARAVTDTIEAANDSIAYCIAFQNFTISKKTYMQTVAMLFSKNATSINTYKPISFSLYDEQLNDLASGDFLHNKETINEAIQSKIDKL